jgi:hypothetical protein
MASTITARLRHVLFALALLGAAGQPSAQEYYYGIELNGVLCGYVTITASPLREGGRTLTLLRHEVVVRGTLLGAGVDNRIVLTYHIDPVTKAFTYHTSRIEQGQTTLTSAVRIEGRTARVSDGRGGPDTTASETDYVDSGHIRIGVVQSLATSLNARQFEVLEHRLAPASGPAAAGGTSGATTFDACIGESTNAERGLVVKVLDRSGRFTVWFDADPAGAIAAMLVDGATVFTR